MIAGPPAVAPSSYEASTATETRTSTCYAALAANAPLTPYSFERREPGEHDVAIDIKFCGICHSDIHQARDEWGGAAFPMVPGHEIVGRVTRVGGHVTRFRPGDLAAPVAVLG